MIPYAPSPTSLLAIAAIMNDEDIARANERRLARDLERATRDESRPRSRAAGRTPAVRRRWKPWSWVTGRARIAH